MQALRAKMFWLMPNRVVVLAMLQLLASTCAAQYMRMESREAPTAETAPRVPAHTREFGTALPVAAVVVAAEMLDKDKTENPPDAIGVGRLPANGKMASGSQAHVIRIIVHSDGAAALRTALRISVSTRAPVRISTFSPAGRDDPVALESSAVEYEAQRVWTAVTSGAEQEIIIEAMDADGIIEVSVERISHFVADPGASRGPTRKAFGDSQYCQIDLACVYDLAPTSVQPSILLASRAVAKMVFSDANGFSYDCTGTLLNSASYPTPFFYSAYHCLSDPITAATLTTYWFFSRDYCQVGLPSSLTVQLPGGSDGIYVNRALDIALVRLKQLPPPPASYSGWDPGYLPPSTTVMAIHHPSGDVKKASFGNVVGTNGAPTQIGSYIYGAGTFYLIDWEAGVVEHGSSGSGLFSYDPSTNYFYLRGTLTGGNASCSSIASRTYYSRLDNAFPYIGPALNQPPPPPSSGGTKVAAIEYYHAGFDHYFITANPAEVAKLDSGIFAGWTRTGQTFNVYSDAPAGTAGVCRFFSTAFAPKSSHFYTPFVNECASVQKNPSWQYEAVVFNAPMPDSGGNCASGTIPVYRLYNNGQGGAPNHRYTSSLAVRSQMMARGWIPEGYGSVGVGLCAP